MSRIDFWNHKSWNQIFIIGLGIKGLGIRCPEFVLESQVLESNVRNWFWNHKSWNQMSGFGVRNHMSWNHMSWNQVYGIGTVVMCQVIARL